MRWSILLCLLLAIQTDFSVFAANEEIKKEDAHLKGSKELFLNEYRTADRCIVVRNNVLYEIYPKMNLTHGTFESAHNCRVALDDITWQDAGNWTLTGYFENEEFSIVYELTVVEKVPVQPAPAVSMSSGYATFYLSKTFENATSCRITNEQGKTYELLEKINSTEAMELYNACGVRMGYKKERKGTWTITQLKADSQEIYGTFTIEEAPEEALPQTHHLFWKRGASESLQVPPSTFHQTSIYCDIVRPDGAVIPLLDHKCIYNLNVSAKHAGVWRGRYGVDHSMKLIEEEFVVDVWNPEAVEISVVAADDSVTMLCRTGLDYLSNCLFESPNGTILSLQGGMGDGNYEYYGSGFTSAPDNAPPKRAECGLIIRNLSQHDYGLWKCSMRKYKEITVHGLIDVVDPKQKDLSGDIITSPAVYVKRGDSFKISCTTNAPLHFCWMRSPNGTMYSVTKSGSGGNLLSYNGEGLSMGECGATVENADDTHNGDWSCQLGVVGAGEVKSIVPVTVTESELIPQAKNISAYQGKPTVLSCHTFPTSEATIDYCRWLRPNGDGLYRDTASRYVSQQDSTTCTLKLNAVTEGDLGTWMCLARLTTGSDKEVWSKIEVKTVTIESAFFENTGLHIVAIILLAIALICTIFMIISLYRRKNRQNQSSPPLHNTHSVSNNNEKILPYFNNLKVQEASFKQ